MIEESNSIIQIPMAFKARHLFVIAYFLRAGIAAQMSPLLFKIKSAINAETGNEDVIPITGTISQIIIVVETLSRQPESEMASTNAEIQETLVSQLTALAIGEDAAVAEATGTLLGMLSSRAIANAESLNKKISDGKAFVLSL